MNIFELRNNQSTTYTYWKEDTDKLEAIKGEFDWTDFFKYKISPEEEARLKEMKCNIF